MSEGHAVRHDRRHLSDAQGEGRGAGRDEVCFVASEPVPHAEGSQSVCLFFVLKPCVEEVEILFVFPFFSTGLLCHLPFKAVCMESCVIKSPLFVGLF